MKTKLPCSLPLSFCLFACLMIFVADLPYRKCVDERPFNICFVHPERVWGGGAWAWKNRGRGSGSDSSHFWQLLFYFHYSSTPHCPKPCTKPNNEETNHLKNELFNICFGADGNCKLLLDFDRHVNLANLLLSLFKFDINFFSCLPNGKG